MTGLDAVFAGIALLESDNGGDAGFRRWKMRAA